MGDQLRRRGFENVCSDCGSAARDGEIKREKRKSSVSLLRHSKENVFFSTSSALSMCLNDRAHVASEMLFAHHHQCSNDLGGKPRVNHAGDP